MTRSIHDYVVKALEPLSGQDLKDLAAELGIKPSTLQKIRKGYIENPGIKSMEILYFHFRATEGKRLRRRAA